MRTLINRFVFAFIVITSVVFCMLFYTSNNEIAKLKSKLEIEKEYNTILRSDMYLLEISNMSYQMYIEQERHKGNIYEIKTVEKK